MDEKNVKIIINETDTTTPAGASIDSTDIAFVPGFSSLPTAPILRPTLCTSVKQFETLFGSSPRVLTANDVTDSYRSYGFLVGDYDRSYIYAKELLYSGMSVVYTNLTVTSESVEVDSANTSINNSKLTASVDANKVVVALDGTASDSVSSNMILTVHASAELAKGVTKVFDYTATLDDATASTLTQFKLTDVKVGGVKKDYIVISGNQIEVTNSSASDETLTFTFAASITANLTPGSSFTLEVKQSGSQSHLDAFYDENSLIKSELNKIAEKSVYSVKYITSGGYPAIVANGNSASAKFAGDMLNAAYTRGDAVALIDYQRAETDTPFSLEDSTSFYTKMANVCETLGHGEYGAAMYPWAVYDCGNTGITNITMPASYAYLTCLAKAIKTSPNWLAMAGVSRGVVRGIKRLCTPGNVLSNTAAENMQPKFGNDGNAISINCITDVKPYGLTLWGNRTLKPVDEAGTVALNFLNVRNMLSDIKKLLYTTAKSLMFEQNSDTLWVRFKNGVSPLLNQLKSGNGISDYKIIKGKTKYNGDPLTKGEMSATIKIYPIYAVEYFELTVEISDEDVTVS